MPKVVVIGAGVMGLAAAFQALLDGYEVDILEASTEPGGMAAHFISAVSQSSVFTISCAKRIFRHLSY